jgi:flagellar biosynthesis/type III secretory pathway protein FliH
VQIERESSRSQTSNLATPLQREIVVHATEEDEKRILDIVNEDLGRNKAL